MKPERLAEIRENDAFAREIRGEGWDDHTTDAEIDRADLLAAFDTVTAELAEARASGSHLAEVAADEYLALKAERDAAQAAIERVRAILDQPLLRTSDPERVGERFLARQIAAALDARGAGSD